MKTRLIQKCTIALMLWLVWLPQVFAGDRFSWVQPEVGVGIEYFSWKEFDGAGGEILKETGPRVFFIIGSSDMDNKADGIIHDISFKGYSGTVDYDGQTQPPANVPVLSDTNYSGWDIDLKIGYRFAGVWLDKDIDLVAGVGVDKWEREIENSVDANGVPVTGLAEDYTISYGRVGVGLSHIIKKWQGHFEIGLKRPVSTDEAVAGFNVSLSPGKRLSGYAVYKIAPSSRMDNKGRTSMSFYYDGFRFNPSSVVGGVYQPKSEMDIFGVTLSRSF